MLQKRRENWWRFLHTNGAACVCTCRISEACRLRTCVVTVSPFPGMPVPCRSARSPSSTAWKAQGCKSWFWTQTPCATHSRTRRRMSGKAVTGRKQRLATPLQSGNNRAWNFQTGRDPARGFKLAVNELEQMPKCSAGLIARLRAREVPLGTSQTFLKVWSWTDLRLLT